MTMTLIQKPTVATFDVQDDEKIVIMTNDDEATIAEDRIGNHFQDTSSEELGTE